jgi:hypothetical protein
MWWWKKIFEPEREKVIGGRGKRIIMSSNVGRVTTSRSVRWLLSAIRMEEVKEMSFGKSEGNWPFERPRHVWDS